MATSPNRRLLSPLILAGAAVALWLCVAATHALGYFLLADDHSLIAEGAHNSLSAIVSTPMFGVYRPLGFLVAHVASTVTPGPSGWIAIVLALHLCNAALVGALGRRLGQSPAVALATAVLFLWSPWSSEAYLWFSGIFDVGATLGILVAAVTLADPVQRGPRSYATSLAALVGCVIAAGFKENGYLAAAIVPALVLSGDEQKLSPRIAAIALLAFAGAAAMFLLRSHLLAGIATPYDASEFGGRLLSAEALPAVASNVKALLFWPVPAVWGDISRVLATTIVWPAAATLVASSVVLAVVGRRRSWLQLAALLLSIAPTAFVRIDVLTITPRRYLYLAGVALCVLMGSALSRQTADTRPHLHASWMAGTVAIMLAMVSSAHQVRLWRAATTTARCAMESFRTQVASGGAALPVLVENMPFAVERGPFMLLEYDFRYVHGDQWSDPNVRFRRTVLTLDATGALRPQPAGEAPPGPEPRSRVTLDLCAGG